MLRDKNLVPLSHQHQHALALCVSIGKAFEEAQATPDVHVWEKEIVRQFDEEISYHFKAEETVLFPAAEKREELAQLVDALRIEHTLLRRAVERARQHQFTVSDLQVFTASLSEHVRKEERQLFEMIQKVFTSEELDAMGDAMQAFFTQSGLTDVACRLPSETKEP